MSRYILRAWRLWVQKVTVILFIWKLLYVVHKELSRRQSRWLPALPMRDMDHHALLQLRTLEEVKWPAYSHKTSRSSTRTQVSDSKPRLLFPLHIEGCLSLITTNAKWQGWNGLFLKIFPALNSLSFSDSGVLCKKKKKDKQGNVWNSFPLFVSNEISLFSLKYKKGVKVMGVLEYIVLVESGRGL